MKRKIRIMLGLTLTVVSLILSKVTVFAEDVTWQQNNSEILSNNSVVEDGIRWISWGLIKLLCLIADIAATLYDKTFGMIDITKYPQLENLVTNFKPVLVAIMILCIIALGISYMVMQQKKNLIRNILISGLVLSSTIYMFSAANDLVSGLKGAVLDKNSGSAAYEIVNNNLIDFVGIDKAGSISSLNYKKGKGIIHNAGIKDKDTLSDINYVETLNWDNLEQGKELYGWSETFNNYIKYKAVNVYGKYEGTEVFDGVLGSTVGNQFYYRYSFDFWTAALEILAMVLVYVALSYKNVRITYELIISRFLAFFFSADIGNGERLKQVLFFIRDTYIALCISIMSIKIFLILTEAITSFGINGLAKGLVAMFIAYAVIDGPNISERILGIDAGLSSSVGRTMAIFGFAKAAARMAKGAASSVGNIGATFASGKTRQERKSENGYATISEKFAKDANAGLRKLFGNKSDEKEKGNNIDTSFMDDTSSEGKKTGESAGKGEVKSEAEALSSEIKINPFSEDIASGKNSFANPNFMEENTSKTGINSSSLGTTQNISSGISKLNKNAEGRYENPEFKEKIRQLAPSKDASIGERRDFNRQVNNIVRGNHKAIKPSENSRADYKETNYLKALTLEKAYHTKAKLKKGNKENEDK